MVLMQAQQVPAVRQNDRQFFSHFTHTVNFMIPFGYEGEPKLEYIGAGEFGSVIKAECLSRDGVKREVAIKKFYDPFANAQKARRLYRELRLIQMMQHESVIHALDIYSPQKSLADFKDVYMVTEYAGDSLDMILKYQRDTGEQILRREHIREIIYQLLTALKYIHSANVMHRDLKPKNLALIKSCQLTLLDFDMARTTGPQLSEYVQTRPYRAPEVIYWKINSYDKEGRKIITLCGKTVRKIDILFIGMQSHFIADMWSLGCIAAEMLHNRVLFPGADSAAQYEMIISLCGSPDSLLREKIIENTSLTMQTVVFDSYPVRERRNFKEYFRGLPEDAIDFLDKILVLDPDRRMSVDDALRHQYIDAVPENEPVAEGHFTLDDEGSRTVDEWKEAIWELIQNFIGNDHAPVFQYRLD